MSAKRSSDDVSSDEDSDVDDEGQQLPPAPAPGVAAAAGRGSGSTTLEQLKREKRLAMNRESARARRRRKKIRLETLEQQAEELSQKHHSLVMTNQTLKTRVFSLETELASERAGVGAVGGLDPSSILGGSLGGGGAARAGVVGQDAASLAAAAGLGLGVEQRAAMAAMAGMGGSGGAVGSSTFGGLGVAGMGTTDPEMQYLQMQQQLLSSQASSGGGTADAAVGAGNASAAARLMALEEMQRRNQLAALRGGIGPGGGQISDLDRLNQQLPGLRRLEDVSARLRGAEGLRGPTIMDLALAPTEATIRQRDQGGSSQGSGSSRQRDLKAELYERLADTNKKFPPRGGS